jgi:hypothetical protein
MAVFNAVLLPSYVRTRDASPSLPYLFSSITFQQEQKLNKDFSF